MWAQERAHKYVEVSLVDQLFEPHQHAYPPFPISLGVKFPDDGRRTEIAGKKVM